MINNGRNKVNLLQLVIFYIFCFRLRPLKSRSTPSGRLCPNWERFTSTTPLAQLTEPTGEQVSDVMILIICDLF